MVEAWVAVVLAAGKGTRMRSRFPKALHSVAGKALVLHVLDALGPLELAHTVLVVGHEAAAVRAAVEERVEYAEQPQALGTGHALLQAKGLVQSGPRNLLVVNGDMPLVRSETLRRAMERHEDSGATVTIITCKRDHAVGLGRVLRSEYGAVLAVIEEAEASEEELALAETNEGVYCFDAQWVWDQLPRLPKHRNGEYYLTDLVGAATALGRLVESVAVSDPYETLGVNDRVQLAQAEAVMRQRVRERLMLSGVTLMDPPSIFIDADVEIGQDTIIFPNTTISGRSRIGEECQIGPGSIILDSSIARGCRVIASLVESSELEEEVTMGPYSHLRPGSHVEAEVHLGNYVEVKNSRIGRRTQVGHFSYIGDATLGEAVNIGAGTVTCNYDGVAKHPTRIGDRAFIGCATMLVAPVTVGEGAATGAGAVVTKNVPPGTLVVGAPARPVPGKKPLSQQGPAS